MAFWKHETACVDEGAIVGEGTKVWHFTHVCAGARIGTGCVLGQNVYVAPTVVLGDGVRVQNNVSLYDGVIVDDHAFIGPSAVFTNVAHPRSEVSRKHAYRPTRVGRGASIGANATIVCGHAVGAYALVGAGAVVTKDVAPYQLVVGVPAAPHGWACACGVPLATPATPVTSDDVSPLICSDCGRRYRLSAGGLAPESKTG